MHAPILSRRGPRLAEFAFERRHLAAKLRTLELGIHRRGVAGEPRQHGALVVIEVGAGGMRPIEGDREAARRADRGHAEDRACEALRQVEAAAVLIPDVEWFAFRKGCEQGLIRCKRARRHVLPALAALVADVSAVA